MFVDNSVFTSLCKQSLWTDLVLNRQVNWPCPYHRWTDLVHIRQVAWLCPYQGELTLSLLDRWTDLVLTRQVNWPCPYQTGEPTLSWSDRWTNLLLFNQVNWPCPVQTEKWSWCPCSQQSARCQATHSWSPHSGECHHLNMQNITMSIFFKL